jgi:hypothetical protein
MGSWDDPPHLKGPLTSPDDYDNQPRAGHPRIRSIRANHVKLLSNDAWVENGKPLFPMSIFRSRLIIPMSLS